MMIGLGAKNFIEAGNQGGPRDDDPASVSFEKVAAKGLYTISEVSRTGVQTAPGERMPTLNLNERSTKKRQIFRVDDHATLSS